MDVLFIYWATLRLQILHSICIITESLGTNYHFSISAVEVVRNTDTHNDVTDTTRAIFNINLQTPKFKKVFLILKLSLFIWANIYYPNVTRSVLYHGRLHTWFGKPPEAKEKLYGPAQALGLALGKVQRDKKNLKSNVLENKVQTSIHNEAVSSCRAVKKNTPPAWLDTSNSWQN